MDKPITLSLAHSGGGYRYCSIQVTIALKFEVETFCGFRGSGSIATKFSPAKFQVQKSVAGILSVKICFEQILAKLQNLYPLKILGYTVLYHKTMHMHDVSPIATSVLADIMHIQCLSSLHSIMYPYN